MGKTQYPNLLFLHKNIQFLLESTVCYHPINQTYYDIMQRLFMWHFAMFI